MSHEARLPTVQQLVHLTSVTIRDNEDGTWTAFGPTHLVHMMYPEDVDDPAYFEVWESNEIYNPGYEYRISSTRDRDET